MIRLNQLQIIISVRPRKLDCVLAVRVLSPKPTHPIQKKQTNQYKRTKIEKSFCVFSVFEGLWCVFCFHFFLRKCLAPRNRNFALKTIWSSFFFVLSFSFLSFPPPPAHPNQPHQSTNPRGTKQGWTVAPTPKRNNNSQSNQNWMVSQRVRQRDE